MALLDNYWPLFLTIVLLVLLKYYFFIFAKKPTKPGFNLPPSPPKLPIIGNLHQLGNNPHISLRNLAKNYGPIFYLDLGQIPTVIISSARLAKEALKTHDLHFGNRPRLTAAKYLFYNCTDMGFSPYGAYWRYIRKICVLELLSAKRVQSFAFVREEEVSRLVRRLAEPYPGTVNLSKMLGLYANDVVCRVSFGRDFSGGGDFDQKGFQKLLEEYQELLGGLSVGDFFPSVESFVLSLTGMKSRLVHTFNRFDELFDQIVAEHLNSDREKDETKEDLVDVLLDIQRNGSGEMPLTLDNVKALILVFF